MVQRTIVTLALACLCVACGQPDLAVRIPFSVSWHGEPISCTGTEPALTDLRFYVNNVQLITSDGRARDIRYATEFPWENDAVALIDLENGDGACANGTAQVYDTLIGAIPTGNYRGLHFTVGVPPRLDHIDPLTSIPPLDDPAMQWHERSGHRFLRAGIRSATDEFRVRIGNRIEVSLPEFVPGKHGVDVDLGALIAPTEIGSGEHAGSQRVFSARELARRNGNAEP